MADKSIKATAERTSLSPGRLFLRRFSRNRAAVTSAVILAVLYLSALLAGFIAPYAMDRQNRQAPFHQPIGIRWSDESG
jgi:peptide/nickel transport system permease protein